MQNDFATGEKLLFQPVTVSEKQYGRDNPVIVSVLRSDAEKRGERVTRRLIARLAWQE